jgi:SAM-dependent methyltransferase
MSLNDFDAKGYWENRLSRDYSLHGVGRLNWGLHYNKWLYKVRRSVFLRALRDTVDTFKDASALDIGSGTGFYLDLWRELGAGRITGADITDVAVARLREKYPDHSIYQLNIGTGTGELRGQQFDIVSCMDVLFHIVDDEQYENAFKNIYSLLKPGGVFVFTDLFLHEETRRASYIVHRTLQSITSVYQRAGFDAVERRPAFVLMNEPLDSKKRLLKLYWRLLQKAVLRVRAAGVVAGAILYPVELVLTRALKESPATEIMLCRKPTGH